MPLRAIVLESRLGTAAFEEAVDGLGGLQLEKGEKIVVVPGLDSAMSEQSGSTVRTEVVEEVVRYLTRHHEGCEIAIVCSSAYGSMVFDELGYTELAARYGNVKLVDLNSSEKVKVLIPDAKALGPIDFPQELLLADAFISVSTLKRHVHERLAAVWVSPFSCIASEALRVKMQPHMSRVLLDLNRLMWPTLCVIDAETALEGTGPVEGRPRYIGKLIVSRDPIAADVAALKLIGEGACDVPYLKFAMKKLKIKEGDIRVEGEYRPTKLGFITGNQYRLWRLGLYVRRWASRLENLGNLILFLCLALVSVGLTDLVKGRWVSVKDSLDFARQVYSRIYEMETLLNRKIVINRHVKEQSIS